ncbi:MAG: ATP-binding protein [Fimbriimonadaceae bacterium]
MENLTHFVEEALCMPDRAMTFMIHRKLCDLLSGQAVIQCRSELDVEEFIRYGYAEAIGTGRFAPESSAFYDQEDDQLRDIPTTSWTEISWQNSKLNVIRVPFGKCGSVNWVSGPQRVAEDFIRAVSRLELAPKTRVFTGWWRDDEKFDRAIEKANWSELVLEPSIRELVETHALGFFKAKSHFDELGVPWKRGILLTGPPGNGKTHLIRAILNRLAVPRLVIKNFGEDADDIEYAFDRIAQCAPCVVVLEDLDSLIRSRMLSSILNHMDGATPLNGVLFLATTNHPEKLDPAIKNRPSRFDRVIEFGPPTLAMRQRLIRKFMARGNRAMKLNQRQRKKLAIKIEGFSFAFIKELMISSAMKWAATGGKPYPIYKGLVKELREQFGQSNRE